MADDHEERSFEVVKLRIAFLQHITTLSGAAILIVLALIQRAETPKGAYELAIAVPWFVVSTLISMAVILMLIPDTEFVHHLRASTGSNSTDLAGAAFTTGVAAVAAHAFDVPIRFFQPISSAIVVASLVTLILRRLYAARKRDAPQAPDSATEGEDRGTGGD
jgi:ABC-type sugar transport system permease subunit